VGVGVGKFVTQTLAPEYDGEPVGLARFDDHLDTFDLFHRGGNEGTEPFRLLRRDPARPAVGHHVFPDGAEIGARGKVPVTEVHVETEDLENAAADLVGHGIVSEEAEGSRTAAGSDARADGCDPAEHTPLHGQSVHVRLRGGLKGRLEIEAGVRDIPEAVEYEKNDLVIVR